MDASYGAYRHRCNPQGLREFGSGENSPLTRKGFSKIAQGFSPGTACPKMILQAPARGRQMPMLVESLSPLTGLKSFPLCDPNPRADALGYFLTPPWGLSMPDHHSLQPNFWTGSSQLQYGSSMPLSLGQPPISL